MDSAATPVPVPVPDEAAAPARDDDNDDVDGEFTEPGAAGTGEEEEEVMPMTTADGTSPIDEDSDYATPTTQLAFGVTALMYLPGVVLSATDKSVTRRVQVNGRDLVAKYVDFNGGPKHSGFSYRELVDLMENEVRAYLYLKAAGLEGQLAPRFVFRGSDINFIWVFVTTYEGESLEKLAELDNLGPDVRRGALASLRRLHAAGVLHGDVELRNAVLRPSDGAVVWIDLEMAQLRGDPSVEDFDACAEAEERALAAHFEPSAA